MKRGIGLAVAVTLIAGALAVAAPKDGGTNTVPDFLTLQLQVNAGDSCGTQCVLISSDPFDTGGFSRLTAILVGTQNGLPATSVPQFVSFRNFEGDPFGAEDDIVGARGTKSIVGAQAMLHMPSNTGFTPSHWSIYLEK